MKMFVFWTFVALVGGSTLAEEYLGCYKYSDGQSDSFNRVLGFPSSASQCVAACKSRYFMFAGLMKGQTCYCSSSYGRNGLSNDCTIPCFAEPNNFCGSDEAVSVYATGQRGPSPPRRLEVTNSDQTSLLITWEPPDIPNGNVSSYMLKAVPVKTHASSLPSIQTKVQSGIVNGTKLTGLHPGTKYNVSVIAVNEKDKSDPSYVLDYTSIGPPEIPKSPRIIDKTDTTTKVILQKGRSDNGPVNFYQVVVVERFIIPPTGENISYKNFHEAAKDSLGYYVTAQFDSLDFQKYENFVVGDGKKIGGYYNAPLTGRFANAEIGEVVISRVNPDVRYAYSNMARLRSSSDSRESKMDATVIALCLAIAVLGALLAASIVVYFVMRRRHTRNPMTKLPEQQELTLQGPVHEVDNMAYIPEDVPERANHYQILKEKVWNIPKNFLTVDGKVIKRGRFGTVHVGQVQKNGVPSTVAVHCIVDGSLRANEKKHMLRDLDVCIKAGTMNYLAGLVGTCETPEILHVVMELPPMTLKNRLLASRTGDDFPVDRILPIGSHVAEAMRHLEIHKIVHPHLCSRTVGLCHDFTPKVMGHGIAKYAVEDVKFARWTAVECFSRQKKSPQGVVWAFGVLVWEMLSMGATPYADLPTDIDVEEAVDQGTRLPQLPDTPDPLYEVLMSCWQINPDERPTFDELVRLNTLSLCPITAITEPYNAEMELN